VKGGKELSNQVEEGIGRPGSHAAVNGRLGDSVQVSICRKLGRDPAPRRQELGALLGECGTYLCGK
jgi:hypothetical protein